MDQQDRLQKFIEWGYDNFQSTNYALALVGPTTGIERFGHDTTGKAFLTSTEIRNAIQQARRYKPRLDILHMDGGLFWPL